ncbi:MAG: polymerase subunit sigma-24, partial [Aeromicrobium sp.]|nr:polymerase subunit sigma-24 [Aeromicrobium sp.]
MRSPTLGHDGPVTGDGELLARAAAGDRLAFGLLYDRYVRPVYWQAYSVLRDDREAEDATQDVFVTTWNK